MDPIRNISQPIDVNRIFDFSKKNPSLSKKFNAQIENNQLIFKNDKGKKITSIECFVENQNSFLDKVVSFVATMFSWKYIKLKHDSQSKTNIILNVNNLSKILNINPESIKDFNKKGWLPLHLAENINVQVDQIENDSRFEASKKNVIQNRAILETITPLLKDSTEKDYKSRKDYKFGYLAFFVNKSSKEIMVTERKFDRDFNSWIEDSNPKIPEDSYVIHGKVYSNKNTKEYFVEFEKDSKIFDRFTRQDLSSESAAVVKKEFLDRLKQP